MMRTFEPELLRKWAPSMAYEESVALADILDATPCDGCEDKQRAIDALNAYVARLTARGENRKWTERKFLEHRTEELTSDDFACVYFDAQDIAMQLADHLDQITTANRELLDTISRIRSTIEIFSPKSGDEMDEYETGKFNMAEYVLREMGQ